MEKGIAQGNQDNRQVNLPGENQAHCRHYNPNNTGGKTAVCVAEIAYQKLQAKSNDVVNQKPKCKMLNALYALAYRRKQHKKARKIHSKVSECVYCQRPLMHDKLHNKCPFLFLCPSIALFRQIPLLYIE